MGTQIADATTMLVNDASSTPVDDSFCDPPGVLPAGYICTDYGSNMSLWLMNYTASYMSCQSFSCDLREHYRGIDKSRLWMCALVPVSLFCVSSACISTPERVTALATFYAQVWLRPHVTNPEANSSCQDVCHSWK